MPVAPAASTRFAFAYPPRGWVLAAVVLAYLLIGTLGHDPWKGDDAVTIGVIASMLNGGEWLMPQLAGVAYVDYPPLYHWVGKLTALAFGWALPLHDAARLASAVFGAGLLAAMAATAREFAEREHKLAAASACALLGVGSLGFLIHLHEAQPMLAVTAAVALTYLGYARMPRQPLFGALIAGTGLGLAHLAGGFNCLLYGAPLALLLPLISPAWRPRAQLAALGGALLLGALIVAAHLLTLRALDPAGFQLWLASELGEFALSAPGARAAALAQNLPWYTWPALPLALWSVWRHRRELSVPRIALPLAAFVLALSIAVLTGITRGAPLLPIVPPLALLAVAGIPSMRRGLANAFDWFGMMSLTFFMALAWVGWLAMATGWPPRLARQVTRLEPGFTYDLSLLPLVGAALLVAVWLALIFSGARSPWRATVHWAVGTLVFWGLIALLWVQWVDYGRSYRAVSASLATAIERQPKGCIIGKGLGNAQIASFYYFDGIITHAGSRLPCKLMLTQQTGRGAEQPPAGNWRKVWEDRRKGDRNEMYRLYVRD